MIKLPEHVQSASFKEHHLSPCLSFSPIARYPCRPRYFGKDAMVCVCNANYCDTVDPVLLPPVGQYLKYVTTKAGQRLEPSLGTFRLNHTQSGSASRLYRLPTGWGSPAEEPQPLT